MTNQHPITPPFEMVETWASMLEYHRDEQVFSKIAQWGADQELEACATYIARSGIRVQLAGDPDGGYFLRLQQEDQVIEVDPAELPLLLEAAQKLLENSAQ
jgi:hypothetical protein